MNSVSTIPATQATATGLATTQQQSPIEMMMMALKSGITIEQMQGVLSVQKDWEANEARKAFVAAMAAFKIDPPEIFKSKTVGYKTKAGGFTGYAHATLGDVADAITHGLAEHGFSHRWDTKQNGNEITVSCTLTHSLGHSESTSLTANPDNSGQKNAIQQVASAVTYLQRYTLLAATGCATKDLPNDDDGAGTGDGAYQGRNEPSQREQRTEQAAQTPPADAPKPWYPQDQFTANLEKWKDVITSGRKTPAQIIAMAETKFPMTAFQKKQIEESAALPA